MFDFFKRKKNNPPTDDNTSKSLEASTASPESTSEASNTLTSTSHPANPSKGIFQRLKDKLSRTRAVFTDGLSNIFLGKKEIDAEALEDLESLLLAADVGVEATQEIIESISEKVSRHQLNDFQALEKNLKQTLTHLLLPHEQALEIPEGVKPYVILMIGVNGAGKTTTIGKLAKQLQSQGKSLMLAAGDTFRAAAIEQLKVWGDRNQIPVISQHTGADSASVIYDAFQASVARNIDVLIADTAGRLHTQHTLMEELKKIVRVLQKGDATAPHEVMLVLDAGIGQNALNQAKTFHEMIKVTGLTLTKLDGTAKGGIIFNIAKNLKLPIRFVGVGEGVDDLRPFSAEDFVQALFSKTSDNSEQAEPLKQSEEHSENSEKNSEQSDDPI